MVKGILLFLPGWLVKSAKREGEKNQAVYTHTPKDFELIIYLIWLFEFCSFIWNTPTETDVVLIGFQTLCLNCLYLSFLGGYANHK